MHGPPRCFRTWALAMCLLRSVVLTQGSGLENPRRLRQSTSSPRTRGRGESRGEDEFSSRVPGSVLQTRAGIKAFRERMQCLAERGRWVHHAKPRPIAWATEGLDLCDLRWLQRRRGHLAGPAANAVSEAARWKVRETLKYDWEVPASCGEWRAFDKADFCNLVKTLGGPLMLAGDSLTRNMFRSLNNHLSLGTGGNTSLLFTPRLCQHWETNKQMPRERNLCEAIDVCEYPIYRVRNDKLTRLEGKPTWNTKAKLYYAPWLSLVKTWGVRGVVLNRGAHVVQTAQFEEELNLMLWVLRQKHPDLLIIYRSTPPGHVDCERYDLEQRLLTRPQNRSELPFGWDLFQEQNAIARRLVQQYGGVFLDVEPLSLLRADSHEGSVRKKQDCLHYCNPGPVDFWVKLLYNTLKDLLHSKKINSFF